MKKVTIYNIIFILFICILITPVIQQITGFPNIAGLKGYFVKVKKPTLITKNIWNGTYQDSLNKYVEDNIGYRSDLVRIQNTVDYYAFNKVNAGSVILGKENYAFEKGYINSALGRDFIGRIKIKDKAKKAAYIQNYFLDKGINLTFLFAPGKGTYHRELIPDGYNPDSISTTNHEIYIEEFNNAGISYIDYQSWFLSMKDTTSYPLYPQYGIHWSKYGMNLALDSLVHFLEHKTHMDLVEMKWDKMLASDKMLGTDYDLGKALNLLWWLPTIQMGYPQLYWEQNDSNDMPKLACISDSYFWNWYGQGLTNKIFSETNFLYYFRQLYSSTTDNVSNVKDLNIIPFLEDHDVILVMFTDANLKDFAYGFIDQIFDLLSPEEYHNISFSYIDKDHLEFSESESVYIIKKGTPQGKTVLRAETMNLKPNTSYVISYEAKGFNILEMDVYPNTLVPIHANTNIKSDDWQRFYWQFNTGNSKAEGNLRIYQDYRPEFSENSYLKNIVIKEL